MPMAKGHVTAFQFWTEFRYGIDGRKSLQWLEDNMGRDWRAPHRLRKLDNGKSSSGMRNEWYKRTPLFNFILNRMNHDRTGYPRLNEPQAVNSLQEMFLDKHTSKCGKRMSLGKAHMDVRKFIAENGWQIYYPRDK